ncbi:MAG: hypothetical protein LBD02_07875 [Christensenellaceae bacterium]|jgi:hypothetical protein|nr:hypothetical protein [Christensenellaceae bacterium]
MKSFFYAFARKTAMLFGAMALVVALALAVIWLSGEPWRAPVSSLAYNDVEVGIVKALAGGAEYAPLSNWIYGYSEGGPVADGFRMTPKEMPSDLPFIPLTEDFSIVIEGQDADERVEYTLYKLDGVSDTRCIGRRGNSSRPQNPVSTC